MDEIKQLTFETVARSKLGDPRTSEEAAFRAERSFAKTQRKLCLEEVRRYQGQTSAEIARNAHLERHAAARRLPELAEAGSVKRGPARVCKVQGTKCVTWWLVSLPSGWRTKIYD